MLMSLNMKKLIMLSINKKGRKNKRLDKLCKKNQMLDMNLLLEKLENFQLHCKINEIFQKLYIWKHIKHYI